MKTWIVAGLILMTAGACESRPPSDIFGVPVKAVFAGYLRQGFEQSDFYPVDNVSAGPWWVTMEEGARAGLEKFARGEGRGRVIVVQVLVQAKETGPVDFGFREPFANSLHVNEVLSAEPMSDAAFQDVLRRARPDG